MGLVSKSLNKCHTTKIAFFSRKQNQTSYKMVHHILAKHLMILKEVSDYSPETEISITYNFHFVDLEITQALGIKFMFIIFKITC